MSFSRVATLSLALAVAAGLGTACADEPGYLSAGQPQQTWMQSIGSTFKKGVDSVTGVFSSKPAPKPLANDAVSLNSPARPRPQTRAAMAKLYEDSGKFQEAEAQYRLALSDAPGDTKIIQSYAHLKVKMGDLADATKLYQKAIRIDGKDPSLLNDLGLCLYERKMNREAIGALAQAVNLQPRNPLYRNNLALMLVDNDQLDAAYEQLAAVHPEAVAHYNLGYLLNRKGKRDEAARHFQIAWQRDPSLGQARAWLEHLHGGSQSSPQFASGGAHLAPAPAADYGSSAAQWQTGPTASPYAGPANELAPPVYQTSPSNLAAQSNMNYPGVPSFPVQLGNAAGAPSEDRLPGIAAAVDRGANAWAPGPAPQAAMVPPISAQPVYVRQAPAMAPLPAVAQRVPGVNQDPRAPEPDVAPLPSGPLEVPTMSAVPAWHNRRSEVENLPPVVTPLPPVMR